MGAARPERDSGHGEGAGAPRAGDSIAARIHALVRGTTRLGPGRRAAVWFQGCPFRCAGCIAPGTLEAHGGVVVDVSEIIAGVDGDADIDGITCSGGEPFAQPAALAAILRGVRNERRGVIAFTGYTLDQLRRASASEPGIADALDHVDVLIDGLYLNGRNTGGAGLRGSDNQRTHFLTPRYADERDYFERYDRTRFELRPSVSGGTMLIGVPTQAASAVWRILGRPA